MVIQITAKWWGIGVGRVYTWVARVKNIDKGHLQYCSICQVSEHVDGEAVLGCCIEQG